MAHKKIKKTLFLLVALGLLRFFPVSTAHAVPSFARQTGMSCNQCHTVFPELTAFGRIFKLGGYVLSKTGKKLPASAPWAGMVQGSFTGAKGLTNGVAPFSSADTGTDRFNLPQQLSLFYGGRILDRVGAFIQGTYDGVANQIVLDLTDIRYADNTIVFGKNLIYGLTLNNAPTAQDVWNTTPVWGFPYAASAVAPTPAATTIIDGALNQQVGGLGAYVYWNNLIYLEGSVYRTTNSGVTRPLGAGTTTDMVVDGAAPYWRLALERRWRNHFFTLGAYGMRADIFPSGLRSGPTDRFTDYAFDFQYQYLGTMQVEHMDEDMPMGAMPMPKVGRSILTVHATWIHENQDWRAGFALGNAANPSDSLNTIKVNLNYYYRSGLGDIGGAIGYFSTTGTADPLLYSAFPVGGSVTGSPDSDGFILEANFRPWEKIKFSLQYVIYSKFNGAGTGYDGFGRNASDNNTLYALVWIMF